MELKKLGFDAFFQKHLEECSHKNLSLGRICAEHKGGYKLFADDKEINANISGKFRKNAQRREDYPAVGDWVLFECPNNEDRALIQEILPRKSKFSRKTAGKETQEQIIASNVDYAFIICALNYDFNPRRIERYLSLVWQSGATPVIVLTKKDLCENVENKINEVENIAFGVDIYAINNISNEGTDALHKYLAAGKTSVLLGSSGAGKSSLLNNLAQKEIMKVNILRAGIEKGRHTTTHKQMIRLCEDGLIIDTPGIRELQLWDAEDGISQTFQDIEELARTCKFTNCTHQQEPGCAVRQAVSKGTLDGNRLENYLKIQKEQEYLTARQEQSAAKVEKDKWKSIHKQIKYFNK